MSITERARPVGRPDLQTLSEVQRPHTEKVTLDLEGSALFVGAMFVLYLDYTAEGKELKVTRDVRTPITVVKKDGSVRTYGFEPSLELNPVFSSVDLGFRPSRPHIFINNGDYKLNFEEDTPTSLTFSMDSKEEIVKRQISGNISHEEFMRDLFLSGRLSIQAEREFLQSEDIATENDIKARMEEQIRRYLEYQRAGKLTPQWITFGRKHAEEIARYASYPLHT